MRPNPTNMWLIFFIFLFPLLNFVLQLTWGKKMPLGKYLAVGNISVAFACSIVLFYQIWESDKVIAGTWEWLSFSQPFLQGKKLAFSFDLYIDKLAALMMLLVTGIATLVHVFSLEYMKKDAYLHRYWAYLGLFCAAMLGILVAGNLLIMFICWELVGVSSYLLIGFWFTKKAPAMASEKAFLMNRIGDMGFLAGILLLYSTFGTINLPELNHIFATASQSVDNVWHFNLNNHITLSAFNFQLSTIGLLLFCGCIAKSAQFPLQSWLPDAMEGPTPVSSLIHAATMVAAGVYLTAKIYALLTTDALVVIAIIGAITAFIAAISAISQTDIKRVLAYSTISQLGYMVMAMGAHGYEFSLFHLITHAFFKCGLFLTAAIIIHEIAHQIEHLSEKNAQFAAISAQDMRYMGGLRQYMPITFYAYMGCMLALAGVPLFSGFLSKEGILIQTLQWANGQANQWAFIVPALAFSTAGITAFYMTRHALLIFAGENRLLNHRNVAFLGIKKFLFERVRHKKENSYFTGNLINFHDAKALMRFPVSILAVFSLFIWFSFSPISIENSWLTLNILPPKNIFIPTDIHTHISHTAVSIVSLILVGMGAFIAYFLWNKGVQRLFFPKFHAFNVQLSNRYSQFATFSFQVSALLAIFDKKIVDGFVNLVASLVVNPHHSAAQFDKKFIDGFFDAIANFIINPHRGSISLSWFAAKFDYHIIDGIVNTIAKGTKKVGENVRNTQTGSLQSYILFALIGILLLGGSAWLMLRGKPFISHKEHETLSEKYFYVAVKTALSQDKSVADFAETAYFSPVLINESEMLATDSSEFARLNEALGDSFAFAKNDFIFFQKQFNARPDSFLMTSDSFPQKHIGTLAALASDLGDSTANFQEIWELFHEKKGSELHFYQISLPIFSENLAQCLLSIKMQCGNNCGNGHKLLLRKEKDGWKVVKVFQKWHS